MLLSPASLAQLLGPVGERLTTPSADRGIACLNIPLVVQLFACQSISGFLASSFRNQCQMAIRNPYDPLVEAVGSPGSAFASMVDTKLALIDGEQLARLMIERGVGVSRSEVYELKRVDSDFFEEV
jgi:restriction endonuclease Mrr